MSDVPEFNIVSDDMDCPCDRYWISHTVAEHNYHEERWCPDCFRHEPVTHDDHCLECGSST